MPMRRTVNFLALLLLVVLAVPAGAALLQPAGSAAAAASPAGADFDNDGVTDLAVGVPGENDFAGAITVLYGVGGIRPQRQRPSSSCRSPGRSRAATCSARPWLPATSTATLADLAVGAPGEVAGSAAAAGAVSILYGSPSASPPAAASSSPRSPGPWRRATGSALAAGDFDNDGFADLAVGRWARWLARPTPPARSASCAARRPG